MGIGRFDTHRTLSSTIMITAALLFVFLSTFYAIAQSTTEGVAALQPGVAKGLVQATGILFVTIVLSILHLVVAGYDYGEWGLGHYHTAWTHISGFIFFCNGGLLIGGLCVIFRRVLCAQIMWGYQCSEISAGVISVMCFLGVVAWFINLVAAINYARAPHTNSPHHHSHIAIPSAPASHV